MADLREVVDKILALAARLQDGTIETLSPSARPRGRDGECGCVAAGMAEKTRLGCQITSENTRSLK
jgi:hypothetical protein